MYRSNSFAMMSSATSTVLLLLFLTVRSTWINYRKSFILVHNLEKLKLVLALLVYELKITRLQDFVFIIFIMLYLIISVVLSSVAILRRLVLSNNAI